MSRQRGTPHHVVVVGGGFAGLQFVKDMNRAPVRITLIDRRNHHLFQPLLYQVATTVLSTSEIAWPIRLLQKDRPEVTTILGEVVDVDRDGKSVQLMSGDMISYDTLVVATGATHAYFGRDEWERFAPGLKTLEDATTIRRRLLLAFERAEVEADPSVREALLTIAVIGAGPTGVELAGTIAELAHATLPQEFRQIDTREARVVLVEAGPRILPAFKQSLSDYALKTLRRLNVDVRLGSPVTDCSAEGIMLKDTFIPTKTIVWAAGVKASPAARWLNIPGDRAGRGLVERDLTIPGDTSVYVIGDTALIESGGGVVPGIAPAAKQQGAFVARQVRKRLRGKPHGEAFVYRHQGSLATIGKHAAVIDFGKFSIKGNVAWWIWGLAHIYFLIGTRWRIAVAWSWLWSHFGGRHSARLITQKETITETLSVSPSRTNGPG
jgi:NADH dehydrogenase